MRPSRRRRRLRVDVAVADLAVADIQRDCGSAIACTQSLATFAGTTASVDLALNTFGHVDILVNGALAQ